MIVKKGTNQIGEALRALPGVASVNDEQELYICASLLETIDMIKNLSFCGALPHNPASPVRAYKKALPKKYHNNANKNIKYALEKLPGMESVNEIKIKDKIIEYISIENRWEVAIHE